MHLLRNNHIARVAFDKLVKIYLTEIEAVACNYFATNFHQQRVKFRT